MNCTQCGALIESDKKFCTQCGARVESRDEVHINLLENEKDTKVKEVSKQSEQANSDRKAKKSLSVVKMLKEMDITQIPNEPIIIQGNMHKQKPNTKDENREIREDKRGIGIIDVILLVLTHPISSGQVLYSHLNKRVSSIYMCLLILLTSVMTYLSFESMSTKVADLFYDVFDYFIGYGMVQYVLDQIGVQVLIIALVANTLWIAAMMGGIMFIYKGLYKIEIEVIECIQLTFLSLLVGIIGKVMVCVTTLISIKLALVLGIFLGVMIATLMIVQLVNRLGISSGIVYTLPVIYLVAVSLKYLFVFEIVKGYF